jgi:hypothetical protein
MALRNAFENLATESTVDEHLTYVQTQERDVLLLILQELKKMNMHLSAITGEAIVNDDVEDYVEIR